MILSAIINGCMLAVGMVIGTKLTTRTLKKEILSIMEESATAQTFKKIVEKVDKMLKNQELIEKATTFFDEATKLVTSQQTKEFFEALSSLLKRVSEAKIEEVEEEETTECWPEL
ncbi:hypothetical protein DRP04_01875 [Archaeoglobales archaeon]|mgnify:CR=1 FL=1|nr:MAG: hypothetical protein DRP04_01875 [Archaeoglobales archaeon]